MFPAVGLIPVRGSPCTRSMPRRCLLSASWHCVQGWTRVFPETEEGGMEEDLPLLFHDAKSQPNHNSYFFVKYRCNSIHANQYFLTKEILVEKYFPKSSNEFWLDQPAFFTLLSVSVGVSLPQLRSGFRSLYQFRIVPHGFWWSPIVSNFLWIMITKDRQYCSQYCVFWVTLYLRWYYPVFIISPLMPYLSFHLDAPIVPNLKHIQWLCISV